MLDRCPVWASQPWPGWRPLPGGRSRRPRPGGGAPGLVRRVAVSAEPVPGPDVPLWSITELWDFGLAVQIVAPRPDEVAAPSDVDWDPGSARSEPGPGDA